MTQRRITFKWVLEDSKTDSQRPPLAGAATRPLGLDKFEQRIALYLLRGLVLLFIVIAAASAAALTPAERQRREAQKGIAQTLVLENKAWQQRDRSLYESLLDPQLDGSWQQAWLDDWRAGEEANADFKAQLLDVRNDDYAVNGEVHGSPDQENSDYMQATVHPATRL
jgi:hypothetical protein